MSYVMANHDIIPITVDSLQVTILSFKVEFAIPLLSLSITSVIALAL